MSELEIVREESEPCRFCQRKTLDEFNYGHMYKLQGITVHYYCVLFSQRIEQNGADEEGVLGFLFEDIMNELNKVKNTKCSFCLQTNASIHCAISKCKLVFHYPCGLQRGSLHQFKDHYKSYCFSHRPKQKIPAKVLTEAEKNAPVCSICFDSVDYKSVLETIWAPCCIKTWYHRTCLQKFSLSSGYFFRCAICNQKGIFLRWVKTHGIHVPDQDASWEMERNAFRDLEYRHNNCDAVHCKNPDRTVNIKDTPWEIVLCNSCASEGVHMSCANLKRPDSPWECRSCKSIRPLRSEKIPARRSFRNRKRNSNLEQFVCSEKIFDRQTYGESSSTKGLKRKSDNVDEFDKTTTKKMKNFEVTKDKQKNIRKSIASSNETEKGVGNDISSENCNNSSDLKKNQAEEKNENMQEAENILNLVGPPEEQVNSVENENLLSTCNADVNMQENTEVANPISSSNKKVNVLKASGKIPVENKKSLNTKDKRLVIKDESSDSEQELFRCEEKHEKLLFKKKGKRSNPRHSTVEKSAANTGPSSPETDEFEVIILPCQEKNSEKTRRCRATKSPGNKIDLKKPTANSKAAKPKTSTRRTKLKRNIEKKDVINNSAGSSRNEERCKRKRRNKSIGSDEKNLSNFSSYMKPDSSSGQKLQLTLKYSNVSKDENLNTPSTSEKVVSSTKKPCNPKHKKKTHKKVSNLKPETLQRDMNLFNEELNALFKHYYERSREKKKSDKSKTRKSSKKNDVSSPRNEIPEQSFVEEKDESVKKSEPIRGVDDGNSELSGTTKKLDVAGTESSVIVNEDEIIEID